MPGLEYGRLKYDLLNHAPLFIGTGAENNDTTATSYSANSAILMGCGGSQSSSGATAEQLPNTTTAGIFFNFRARSTHTSGDSRLFYQRLFLNGAGGGGETARIFTTVNAACTTARGAHISLSYTSSGTTSGLGTAITGTLHVPNTGTMTGNLAAIQAELYCDSGADDDVTIPATHGILRLSVSGDAGTTGDVKNLLHITGISATDGDTSTANILTTGCADQAFTKYVRILVDSTPYWFPVTTNITGDGS